MSSEKQAEANRRNAQQSTGPRTQEGKDTVRFNALKHGLRAVSLDVLPTESPAEYLGRLDTWFMYYRPSNPGDEELVRHGADISWKLDRIDRYDTARLTRMMVDAMQASKDQSLDALTEAAILCSFDPSIDGERLRRYQLSLQREFSRTLAALDKLRPEGSGSGPVEVRVSQAASAIGANEAKVWAVPPDPRAVPVAASPAPNEPKSVPVSPPNRQEPQIRDLFAGIPTPAEPKRADRRPASAPAPNEAKFARGLRGRLRHSGKRPVDLLVDSRPNEANSDPLGRVSCLGR